MIWEWWKEYAKLDGAKRTQEAVSVVDRHREDLERRADLIESIINSVRREDEEEEV
jgi:hypothetical protein